MPDNLMDNIVKKTLAGISEAQEDYNNWTGDHWLWEAPEYMVTTYIAKQISDLEDKSFYLTLEHKVKDAIDEAGGLPVGRPRKILRLEGKFDILVWWAKETPRAVIEVKKQVEGFSDIEADVSRICGILSIPDSSFRCGFIVYYTSKYKTGSAKKYVSNRVEGIAKEVKKFTYEYENGLKFKRYPREVEEDGSDDAWTAEVLKISR